ncbi:uncharacterized protein Sfp33A1 [Drosophila suzukii]|uniref:Uncharacterized protein Sfp33A1 n=1 Tax=Drosophila suzukii TaxID=28584 RepID=A0AB39ZAD8_DROSZ
MKFFICLSLLLACSGLKVTEDNIITELCFKPYTGPACQKMKTFYWNKDKKACSISNYLMEPCGFFHKKETCNTICSKESWTLPDLEKYVSKLP